MSEKEWPESETMSELHLAVHLDQHGQEWRFMDKDDWGDGPWQFEPDKLQWTDLATGLVCLALRHPRGGHWCGYVSVSPSNKWHGTESTMDCPLDVHGGITFGSDCQKDARPIEERVCHTPEPGEPDDLWWLGFACAHGGDMQPKLDITLKELGVPSCNFPGDEYRDIDYVIREVVSLCRQVSE